VLPERPQRFSTTSGMEQSSAGKRTWTVGDEENEETHRGGRKHSRTGKKGRPKGKEWGTGVNAIPVG
jgi:nucleolar protein 6